MKHALAFLILAFGLQAVAAPAEIFIIRHGEKADHSDELSPAGFQRAQNLAVLFTQNTQLLHHGPLCALIAAYPDKDGGSVRPIQTITPLSHATGLPINERYTKDDLSAMVASVQQSHDCDGRSVLIAWVHNAIPEMASEFGVANAPKKWSGDVYDAIWDLDMTSFTPQLQILQQGF